MYEIESIINDAVRLNPNFPNLTTQQQYEYIQRNLEPELIKEELEFYYDSKFEKPNMQFYNLYK
ncbi:MAG: hypothetical protein M0R17_04930 [Candidatus Omnitrophica bacterium]|jgi:hypothetical protein|nr:hypothetical protein [Candidatus Omnitrophota bacterium]